MTDLMERINSIPHLYLGKTYDVPSMLKEVESIRRFDPYQTKLSVNAEIREKYASHWSGASLVSSDGTPYSDMTEELVGNKCSRTPLADECPYLYSIAEEFSATALRVRVMRIGPAGSLLWHSHMRSHGQLPWHMTVHVPIVVPDLFRWSVMHSDDFINKVENPRIWSDRYEPGRAMCFNSYHHHNVFNDDPSQYRVSLMFYCSLKYDKAREIFEAASIAYDGPIII